MSNLARAIAIAAAAHEPEVDEAGAAYVLHPLRVMSRMKSDPERMAAVLHDVVENTAWTLDLLEEEGFSREVVDAVDCLTRRKGEDYGDYVQRAATNPIALNVKLADLEDNIDPTRLKELTEKSIERLRKYHRWREYLLNVADPASR